MPETSLFAGFRALDMPNTLLFAWFSQGLLFAIFATCYSQLSLTKPNKPAQEPPQTPRDWPQKPQDSPRWPRNGPQNVRQSSTKSEDHMFGSLFLAILGPLGPTWAQLGPLLQQSCHLTSLLDTSIAKMQTATPKNKTTNAPTHEPSGLVRRSARSD